MIDSPVARAIFESCPAPTFIVDRDIRVLRANAAARSFFGSDLVASQRPTARTGDVIRCLHSFSDRGCGEHAHCGECVIRDSVRTALTTGAVHRKRTFMQVRGESGKPAEICVLVSASPLPDLDAKQVLLSLENVSDVQLRDAVVRTETDQKRTLEQLASEKERLAVTLASIGDAVIATDEQCRITIFNPVAEALTGWGARECLGRHIDEVFQIVSEDTRARAENPALRALREGVVVGLANHTALVARDGTERPIADSAAPIRDAAGKTGGVVLVFRDQTKERHAEQALRASERRIRVKLESILSPEGDLGTLELGDIVDADALHSLMVEFNKLVRIPMAVIDLAGKVLVGVGWQDVCTRFHRVHPDTCKHCIDSDTQLSAGVPAGEIRLYKCKNNMWDVATPITIGGHHLGNVFMGQFFFDDEPVDYDLFRSQAARYGFEEHAYLAALDAVPRLGRDFVAAAMAFFLQFAGMLSHSSFSNLKLARSVAERERLMAALRETTERLEAEDRRKNEFLAVLSHELRNPLAPIRNALYILDSADPAEEQARRAREVAGRQLSHLTRLVDDLLDVTRIVRGKVELRRTNVDLTELARRTGEDYRALMHERGISFEIRTPAGCLSVHGDETRLTQIVGNLLQNAAKFTPEGGRVTLSVSSDGSEALIRVRDSGSGVDPTLIGQIFEPFVQAKQSLARTEGGLGLGLALVKGLTELHGGTVAVASGGPEPGAEFTVRLPGLDEEPAAAPCRRTGETGPARSRILVVDDNRDAAESLADLVRVFGHDADVALDGPSALRKIRQETPDAVLCDIGLPGMSGYEVARALRSERRFDAMRLVAVSGYAQPEDRDRALEAGFDEHIPKPADPAKLERLLSRGAALAKS